MLEHYAFDGWLVNIEAPLPGGVADHARLVGFLGKLRDACRSRCAMAKVIICMYTRTRSQSVNDACDVSAFSERLCENLITDDSLSARGHVEYSNGLLPHNIPLFNACDGIFLNYWCAH